MEQATPKDNVPALKALLEKLSQDPSAFAVIVAGPSGVGKTTLCRELLKTESDAQRCVTTTTRPARMGEVDGVERHFVSLETFENMLRNGALIEHAEVHGHFYGASLDAVYAAMKDGRMMLMDVDVQGVSSWQKSLGDRCVTVFVLPPSLQILEERLASRQTETESTFQLRMKNAIEELHQAPLCDYIIVNDQLCDSVADLKAIIQTERRRASRMQAYLSHLGLAGM
ncbi:MAG: guanylate kinase [Candidatus Latescibacteria bacterium]|jgi:guanylate kinase|nr:guanylate kinase [Candidatus Latescibacterota bacterium]MBT4136511.1 guanylate kinase [Candidatus Latescibacterota bacterium]